jgi:hypothetical protein
MLIKLSAALVIPIVLQLRGRVRPVAATATSLVPFCLTPNIDTVPFSGNHSCRHTSIEIRARGALTGRAAESIDPAVMLQRESYPQESVTFGRFG